MIKFIILTLINIFFFFSFHKKYYLKIYLTNILNKKFFVSKIKKKIIFFFLENSHCLQRYKTILTKEKKTIQWLNKIKQNEILWDIGANIGIYSLYASKIRNAKVVCFEPMSNSYNTLIKNIEINALNKKILAYPVALGAVNEPGFSIYESNHSASARHVITNNNIQLRKKFESIIILKPNFFKKLPKPTHIKIDTDGNEINILNNLNKILMSKYVKEICLEIEQDSNFENNKTIIKKFLKKFNFENYDYEKLSIGFNFFFKKIN
jgi:FkbM family methyltransferase